MNRRRDRGAIGPAVAVVVASASALALAAGLVWIRQSETEPASVTRTASPSAIERATAPPAFSSGPGRSGPDRPAGPATPARPRLLELPSVGASLPIVPVGVSSDGQMQMPPDPADIGWYQFGPRPGSVQGSAVLAGHVDSLEYGVGPLARLSSLHRGDRVVVRTTARTFTFRVVQVRVVAKSDVALTEVFRRGGSGALRIVTCGPPYIASQGGYQDNVIVTAVRA